MIDNGKNSSFLTRRVLSKPFFPGISGGLQTTAKHRVKDLLNLSGGNTGNFLFVQALRRLLGRPDLVNQRQNAAALTSGDYDYIAISAANWVNPRVDLQSRCEMIESTDLPCLVVGLGIQTQFGEGVPKLKKGTERFLKVVSERSRYISVRCPMTQEVLRAYGIHNVWVTGCPSLIGARVGYNPNLIKACPEKFDIQNVVIQGTRHGFSEEAFVSSEVKQLILDIYKFAFKHNCPQLFQSELPDMYYAMGRLGNKKIVRDVNQYLLKVYGSDIESTSSYLRDKGLVFWDLKPWFAKLSSYDFLIGTRIHGVVSALLSGIPAKLVVHDERTRGLARVMNIPSVNITELKKFTVDKVREIVLNSDMATFSAGFDRYKSEFHDFFRRNDVLFNDVIGVKENV
jgi:hypothetical protein